MKSLVLLWHIIGILIVVKHTHCSVVPFVVLPPLLRINAVNTIIVTPVNTGSGTVDIYVTVTGAQNGRNVTVFEENLKTKSTGSPHNVSFRVSNLIEKAKIVIEIQDHEKFESEIQAKPNLAVLHIHTDKPIYSAGEKVSVRALPLTYEGGVYDGIIDFALVNPNGFELVRKQNSTSDGYIELTFELPGHLFYGEWHVVAKPKTRDNDELVYDVAFKVNDYALPPFKIFASISNGQPLNATEITVEARHYYGSPMFGSMLLYCNLYESHTLSTKRTLLVQSQIANGLWRDHIDISKCFMDGNHKATSILVQIRDRDTGDRSELSVAFDPLVPGFEIVPLRPAFSNNTKYILLMMQSISTPRGVELDVRFQCLGDVSRPSIQVKTTVGKVLSFDKPSNWDICRVIMIEASRQVGLLKSRKKSLMLPSISGVKSMEPSWIELHPSHSSYFVGERLLVTVPRNRANALSYIIICNLYSMPSSGHFEEDGSLTVIITQVMVGQCVLLVHSTDGRRATDMIEFNVEEKCQVSILSTSDSIKPAESVTLTLNGHPHGIALVRAIDDRLNTFTSEQNGKRRRSWDFLLFHQVQFGNSQAKAINFSMFDEVTRAIEQSCSSVACEYIKSFGTCPDATSSLSEISNFCLDIMISECLYPVEPTVAASNACDLRNPRGCDTSLEKTISSMAGAPSDRTPRMFHNSTHQLHDPSVVANQNGLDIRQYFYEVWLFDAVPLGPLGTVSRTVKAPDTVGRWSISSVFWTPGQRDLCAARRVVIASKKDVFMKIDLPKSVYLNETINAKVSVTAINPSRETKYTICLSEMSRKMCADLGSFGQLGEPGYSRVILSPSRPTDTKTFAIRFLDIGITSMTIIIRDEATFPGRHHCSIGEIRDIVKQKIRVAKRVETEELYKTVILDTSQPSNPVMNYAVDPSETPVDVFSVRDYRLIPAGDILVTHVHAHIPNPDIVYSFIIDISKFLPNNVVKRGGASRSQRSADYGRSFLSDILKALSVELYQFKRVKSKRYPDHRIVDNLKNRIGALLSDMFRFSDCKNESECGYAEYRSPRNPKERSIALTAISTSLLCEAAASRRLVCGSLRYLLQSLLKDWKEEDINLDELVDLEHFLDKQWFLKAFLLQVSRDCAAYECVTSIIVLFD